MMWKLDIPAAKFCRDVYDDPKKLLDNSVGEVVHCEGEEYGGDAYVFETETHNWVIFRGVDLWTGEFWTDMRTALRSYWKRINGEHGGLKLHGGFFKAWQEIAPTVSEEIMNLRLAQKYDTGEEKPTVYAGHSGGGALAGIAAATHRPHALITFGAPRFSGKALGEYLAYTDHVHRWVNGADWVPMVPFGFGYRHHGTEYLLGYSGEVTTAPSIGKRWKEVLLNLGGARRNHRMTEYFFGVLGNAYMEGEQ